MSTTLRFRILLGLGLGLGWLAPAAAQEVKPGGPAGITISGILGSSVFVQDAIFGLGNGQKAQFVTREPAEDAWWHGADARNMRITLRFAGPEVAGEWRVNGTFETDYFAMFPGSSAFSDEMPIPRLRLAFLDLTNGRTTLRVGQDWALTWGVFPTSTSHIGFPFGWGPGGLIGWRFGGVQLHHRLTLPDPQAMQATLKLGVYNNSWTGEPADADGPSLGEAGWPQLEARLDLTGPLPNGAWQAYAVGHFDRKDLSGVGAVTTDDIVGDDELTSWAAQAGGKLNAGRLTLQGNAYYGKAMGHHFAHIIQLVDAKGWGAWAQAGFNLTPRWSVWGFFGTDDPEDETEGGFPLDRTSAWQLVPMLRWQSGPFAAGLEWLHNETHWTTGPCATPPDDGECSGNQIILSGVLNF